MLETKTKETRWKKVVIKKSILIGHSSTDCFVQEECFTCAYMFKTCRDVSFVRQIKNKVSCKMDLCITKCCSVSVIGCQMAEADEEKGLKWLPALAKSSVQV